MESPSQALMKALTLKSAVEENRQREEARQQQMSLREAFSTADMDTPEGRQDLIRKAGAINPNIAMQLSQHFSQQETQKIAQQHQLAAMTESQLRMNIEKTDFMGKLSAPVIERYDDLIKKGATPEEASAAVSGAHKQALMVFGQAQGMKPEQIQQMASQPFNIDQARMAVKQSATGRQMSQDELARRKLADTEKHMERMEELRLMQIKAAAQKAQGNPNAELDKDTLTQMAQQYLAGDNSVKQGLGYGVQGSKNRVNLQKAIQEEARKAGMSPQDVATSIAEFQGLKAGERTLATRAAQASMAVNEANNMADLVTDASSKVSRTNFIPANKAIIAYQKNTGDPEVVKYGAAINSFINAYARAISPTGQPTVSDKDHGREMLEAAQSHKQVVATIDQMKKEMAAAKEAPAQSKQELRNLASGRKEEKPKQEAPAGAIDYLKAHPELKDQFKAKYGYLPEGM